MFGKYKNQVPPVVEGENPDQRRPTGKKRKR
jgi:hypothetical protein